MSKYIYYKTGRFESTKFVNTHKCLAAQTLNVLLNNIHSITNNELVNKILNEIVEEYAEDFIEGAIAPDYGTVGRKVHKDTMSYSLYQDHFFDPDSEKNFTSSKMYPFYEVPDTAESQCRINFARAIHEYKQGNKKDGAYLLGKAVHFFSDLNQCHHASNVLGGPLTCHTEFEKYVEKIKDKHMIDSIDLDLYKQFEDVRFNDFVTKLCFKHARYAKTFADKVTMKTSYEMWDNAADKLLKQAITGNAVLVYRFINEVLNTEEVKLSGVVGKFHMVASVADVLYAGTNDDIKFGIMLKSGKVVEFDCDLPGDDFERGTTCAYQFISNNIEIKDIKQVYIKKITKGVDDQLLLDRVQLFVHGEVVVDKKLDKWISKTNDVSKFTVEM